MPLFVPVLRSAMLFMNIYDSYKTLKPPPPSSRDPTRPSVRAMTQRKRDLKGCLAVWIVYCCFTLYERLVESFISLFIPFYDEFKSMAILFLILTRARGAEPIFLHVLRPLIRPYDASIDGTLDVLRMTGDFIFALGAYPIQQGIKFLRDRFTFLAAYLPADDFDNTVEPSDVGLNAGPTRPTASRQSTGGSTVRASAATHRPTRRQSSESIPDDFLQSPPPVSGLPLSNATPFIAPQQIWHPPASSYEDSNQNGSSHPVLDLPPQDENEDWRKYPDFPSAYPATPPTATTSLPPSFGAAATDLFSAGVEARQDFHMSLKPTRKPQNPGYATNLSDEHHNPGIPQPHDIISETASETAVDSDDEYTDEEMDEDEYEYDDDMYTDEEEDSFDKTLQTPLRIPRRVLRSPSPENALNAPLLSVFPSQSTAVGSNATVTSLQTPISPTSSSQSSGDVKMGATVDPPAVVEEAVPKTRQRSGTVTKDRPTPARRRVPRAASPVKKRKVAVRPLIPTGGRNSTNANSPTTPSIEEPAEGGAAGTEMAEPDVYDPSDPKPSQPEPKRPRVAGTGGTNRRIPAGPATTISKPSRGGRGGATSTGASGSARGGRGGAVKATRPSAQVAGTTLPTKPVRASNPPVSASGVTSVKGQMGTGGTGGGTSKYVVRRPSQSRGGAPPGVARKASAGGESTNTEERTKTKDNTGNDEQ